jgi:uncharacterized protein (DUF1778 family)
MRRLSIEITLEQHQKLKAIAALRGKSIKDYVLERVLPSFREIAQYTVREWGEQQALRYANALSHTFNLIGSGDTLTRLLDRLPE